MIKINGVFQSFSKKVKNACILKLIPKSSTTNFGDYWTLPLRRPFAPKDSKDPKAKAKAKAKAAIQTPRGKASAKAKAKAAAVKVEAVEDSKRRRTK